MTLPPEERARLRELIAAPIHPLAVPQSTSGANGMRAGDRVVYTIDGRTGRADEFKHDGYAFMTWDDGTYGIVKWNHLEPAPAHLENNT